MSQDERNDPPSGPPEHQDSVPVAFTPAPERWTLLQRVAFRFAFVYLVLYCWPSNGRVSLLEAIPVLGETAAEWAGPTLGPLCSWVASHIFHLPDSVARYHQTGSGDTTLDYIQLLCFAVISACAAVLWSILDSNRPNYRILHVWLRLVVRFTLAFSLLSYGFVKIYPLQFPEPPLSTLTRSYGESSPMGLLWTFMGASTSYTMFAGFAEVTSGLLLLFRRSATFGALAGAAVMLNIVMLNFCYDVPVIYIHCTCFS